ncbi:uncharacterized protein PG986_002863 [Apiospora aurea]|uniref:Uncharacterized protein n=1 Tax=Apiospora aurea TaxID=335848 RepID=A0ABR1QQH8_9PEZI
MLASALATVLDIRDRSKFSKLRRWIGHTLTAPDGSRYGILDDVSEAPFADTSSMKNRTLFAYTSTCLQSQDPVSSSLQPDLNDKPPTSLFGVGVGPLGMMANDIVALDSKPLSLDENGSYIVLNTYPLVSDSDPVHGMRVRDEYTIWGKSLVFQTFASGHEPCYGPARHTLIGDVLMFASLHHWIPYTTSGARKGLSHTQGPLLRLV